MKKFDLIIKARWLVPVIPRDIVLKNYAIVIKDNKIIDLLSWDDLDLQYDTRCSANESKILVRENHIVIPALVNAHCHLAMSLFRGYADDLKLYDWLSNHIWKMESKFVSPDFIKTGSKLAMAEMIKNGIGCFADMYFYPEEVIKLSKEVGIRAFVGITCSKKLQDRKAGSLNNQDKINYIKSIYDEYHYYDSKVTVALDPHAPYTVDDEYLRSLIDLSEKLNIKIMMHIHESKKEIDDYLEKYGARPLDRLDKEFGLLSSNLIAIHMVFLSDQEIDLIKSKNVSIVHCPESNMKLANGMMRLTDLYDNGVNIAIGTDGAASNNDLDMIGEMKTSLLLSKLQSGRADNLKAENILYMATMGGAKALGLDDKIGSIEIGKLADLSIIDFNELNTLPLYNIYSNIVYSLNSKQFSDVIVDGKLLMENRRLITIDEEELKEMVIYNVSETSS